MAIHLLRSPFQHTGGISNGPYLNRSSHGQVPGVVRVAPPQQARVADRHSPAPASIYHFTVRSPTNNSSESPSPGFVYHYHHSNGTSADSTPDGMGASRMTNLTTNARHGSMQSDGTYEVNQYVLLQSLGCGAQGEVMLAMDMVMNELKAIKILPRNSERAKKLSCEFPLSQPASGSNLRGDIPSNHSLLRSLYAREVQVKAEIEAMKRCRHRNIVSLFEVIDDPAVPYLYLVMQYVEHGSLVTMQPDGRPDRTIEGGTLLGYARQLLAGLHYLHSHGVIHRDIKPDNCLLGRDDVVYLSDFGVAEVFDASAVGVVGASIGSVSGTHGTSVFIAPELLLAAGGAKSDGKAVDVFALGISLFVMLYGQLPWNFKTACIADYWDAMLEQSPQFPERIPGLDPDTSAGALLAEGWRALLESMLQKDPSKRCRTEQARHMAKSLQLGVAGPNQHDGTTGDQPLASQLISGLAVHGNSFTDCDGMSSDGSPRAAADVATASSSLVSFRRLASASAYARDCSPSSLPHDHEMGDARFAQLPPPATFNGSGSNSTGIDSSRL